MFTRCGNRTPQCGQLRSACVLDMHRDWGDRSLDCQTNTSLTHHLYQFAMQEATIHNGFNGHSTPPTPGFPTFTGADKPLVKPIVSPA